MKRAFDEGGSAAGAAALTPDLLNELGTAGDVETCLRRIQQEEAAGVNLHSVNIDTRDPIAFGRAVEGLLR